MKKIITIIAVLAIVGIGFYYMTSSNSYHAVSNIPASSAPLPSTSMPAISVTKTSVTPAPSSITVNIKNFSFNPSTLTVKVGTKVTWVNNDSAPHTITSDSGNLLNSPTLSPGQSFSFTFTSPATINYHCNIHPSMKGVIAATN